MMQRILVTGATGTVGGAALAALAARPRSASVVAAVPKPVPALAGADAVVHLAVVMGAIYTGARLGKAGRLTKTVGTLLGRPPRRFRQFASDNAASWR